MPGDMLVAVWPEKLRVPVYSAVYMTAIRALASIVEWKTFLDHLPRMNGQ